MTAEIVLARDLRERAVPVVVLSLSIGLLTFGALGVYSGMSTTLDDLTQDFPEEVLTFIGGDGPGGYVVGEVFNLIAPLALVSYAVMSASSATAGEEQRKTLGLVLGAPVSRAAVMIAKALGLLVGVVAATGLFLVSAVVSSLMFDVGLDIGHVLATGVHLGALVAFFGAVSLLTAAATGRPGLASGVAGGLALASYLSASMLPLADLDRWAELSPWFYYAGSDPLANGLDPTHLLVLTGLTGIALAVAVFSFVHRDLKG